MLRTACVVSVLLALFSSCEASAEEKRPPKPVVCLSYELAPAGKSGWAVCKDGKKPVLLTRWVESTIPGRGEGTVKVLVGWR